MPARNYEDVAADPVGAAPSQGTASVVIPTWLRAPWLERCLVALSRQDQSPRELLVVGRADDLDAQLVVERIGRTVPFEVRWIQVDRPGYIAPVRRGFEAAEGEIVAFLDDDTEAEPQWLAAIVGPFANDRVACVGGRVVVPGYVARVPRHAGMVEWYGKFVGNVGEREDAHPIEVDGVMEGNCAWRRSVLQRLNFDPVLDFDDSAMYGLDLTLQAKKLGYVTQYYSGARVVHHAAPRDPQFDRAKRTQRAFVYSRNYTYIALKHLPLPRRVAFLMWWCLIGDRGSYGLVFAIAETLARKAQVSAVIRASIIGRWRGFQAWLYRRPAG